MKNSKNNIHKKIINFYSRVISHYKRKINFKKWLKENENNTTFVVLDGIGDAVWFLTFFNAYKKEQEQDNSYTIVTESRLKDLFLLYGETNLSFDTDHCVISGIFELANRNKIKKYPNIHLMVFPTWGDKTSKLINEYRIHAGIMMDDYFRFGCFDLSYEKLLITYPPVFKTTYIIKSRKNILLIPYTRSRINIPVKIWEKISYCLKDNGYTVYTNIGTEKEKAIDGTVPLKTDIIELPSILNKYEFISLCGRCGLADWLFVNECKQLILHSSLKKPKNSNEHLWSAVDRKDSFKIMKRKLEMNENVAEDIYLYLDDLEDNYYEDILQLVRKLEKDW